MSASCKLIEHYGVSVMFFVFKQVISVKGYMTIAETAKKWRIGERRINTLCLEGRIKGAEKFGTAWAIPSDAEKPADKREKSGKYKNWRKKKENSGEAPEESNDN